MNPHEGFHGRVLLLLASSTGGIGAHVSGLAEGLAIGGTQVSVAGPAATEAQFGFSGRGASFTPIEIPANPHPSDMRAVRALRHLIDEAQPDILHAHGLRAGLAAAMARPSCPLVVTWHNAPLRGGLRGRMHKLIERMVGRAARVTLCASPDLASRAKAVGAGDVRFAPVSAPPLRRGRRSRSSIRSSVGAADEAPLVLSVGRLHPQKGYPTLIEAAARWRDMDPAPKVLIAGEGPSYLDLAAQISELHAPVTLLGHRTDVADLLAASDIAVVSSLWEARQLFAQEALTAGVPLIATAVGGIPELVGDAAVLIPPSDPDALDRALRKLVADPAESARLAERGLARARSWPDERSTVATVAEVYRELSGADDEGRESA